MSEIDRSDERWYQRAVFYEVSVRSFYDANGDAVGFGGRIMPGVEGPKYKNTPETSIIGMMKRLK